MRASCAGSDPESWFVAGPKSTALMQICASCPVAVQCLASALLFDERYGVWAGTDDGERLAMRRRLASGVPLALVVDEHVTALRRRFAATARRVA